jgi:hypothetical protein
MANFNRKGCLSKINMNLVFLKTMYQHVKDQAMSIKDLTLTFKKIHLVFLKLFRFKSCCLLDKPNRRDGSEGASVSAGQAGRSSETHQPS